MFAGADGGVALAAHGDYVYVLRGNTLYQFAAKNLELVKKVTLEEDWPMGRGRGPGMGPGRKPGMGPGHGPEAGPHEFGPPRGPEAEPGRPRRAGGKPPKPGRPRRPQGEPREGEAA